MPVGTSPPSEQDPERSEGARRAGDGEVLGAKGEDTSEPKKEKTSLSQSKTMAKRRRKYDRNFVAIPINVAQSLGTLGDDVVIKIGMQGANLTEDLFIYSIEGTHTIRDATAGEGPLLVGFAHDDYSVSEIAEATDVGSTMLGPSDKIESERARRLVRKIGTFRGREAEETLNEGSPIKTRVKWTQQDGGDPSLFIQNRSNAALAGGTVYEFEGYIYGKWLV